MAEKPMDDLFKYNENKNYVNAEKIDIAVVLLTILTAKKIITIEEFEETKKYITERRKQELKDELENNPAAAFLLNLFCSDDKK